jgi:hypothetical protein
MSGEQDASGRFDYLFEPLDGEVATTDDDVAASTHMPDDRRSSTPARRIGIVAVIAAAVATIAVAALLLLFLNRAEPADQVDPSVSTSSPSPVAPIATAEPAVEPPPPELTASAVETPDTTAIFEPPFQPQPVPTSANTPTMPAAPPPTVRAPISVEPQTHPPFPNQQPSRDGNQPGGLLPGGGLPGPL